jgi:asparagine N-glycosylation enzyme membrane subunit Stt3
MNEAGARRWWGAVALIWTIAAFLYWWTARDQVAAWSFPDADDQMRLQQVRDLLAGQSWFDVTQYRVNPPAGAPMHWSRWVDLPIAALLLLARPFAGQHSAELFACIAVPLVTLGAAVVFAALLARRLGGPAHGLMAAALAPFTTGTLQQMHVLRIDHHGWQMVLPIDHR